MEETTSSGPALVLQLLRGVDNSILAIACTISSSLRAGNIVSSLLFLRDTDTAGWADHFDHISCLGLGKSVGGLLPIRQLLRLRRVIMASGADAVVAHRYKEFIQLLLVNRLWRQQQIIGVFHGERDFNSRFRRWLCSWLIDENCSLIAVSPSVREYLLASLPGMPKQRVTTIHNGIDFAGIEGGLMCRDEARKALDLSTEAVVYGSVGRLAQTKGTDILVRAFSDVAQANSDAILVIMGEGGERAKLERLVASLGLQGRVLLPGNIPAAPQYLRAIDVFVFPSVREGFGLALVEAIAAKVPVVFSDIAVFRQLAKNQRYMVAAGEVTALADMMNRVTADEQAVRDRIVEEQYQYAAQHFTIEQTRRAYLRYFSGLGASLS